MRKRIKFELVFEYDHVRGNRRFFKEHELLRITEISGIQRTRIEQTGYNAIRVDGYWDEEIIQRILAEIEGPMQRILHFSSTPNTPGEQAIDIALSYEYSKQDLESAPFLQVLAKHPIAETDFEHLSKYGGCPIRKSSIKSCSIGFPGYWNKIACNHDLKAAIEQEEFMGIRFEELLRTGNTKKSYPHIYNLTSSATFPPLTCKFIGENYKILSDYPTEGSCHIHDSCLWQRLIYKYTDIHKMLGTDFAMSFETFGHVSSPEKREENSHLELRRPRLIASQRFKRWCDSKKLKLTWHPVEILHP